MRELKFRVWNARRKEMLTNCEGNIFEDENLLEETRCF